MTDNERLDYIIADQLKLVANLKSLGRDTSYPEDVARYLRELKELREKQNTKITDEE